MKGLYAHLQNIKNLAKLAEGKIEELEETIIKSQKELKVWQGLLVFSQTCRRLANEEASENKCLEHLRSFADDDRSANHMAHRPKKEHFDSDTADFGTLIDCQLAVEAAHENWQKKQQKK